MSIAIATLDTMINEVAGEANIIAAHNSKWEMTGAEMGNRMKLAVLKEVRQKVMLAEMKASEERQTRLDEKRKSCEFCQGDSRMCDGMECEK